ncbi:MAG: hypothetical protein A3F72_16200 [Bacteroidetes bacterium RIFCSPLOWO2_12_FULL_35_15]|nr:MAG: hypothetical protein A3F72_16200 [Bacteroidetes bacterium RIFCSPLOWO2_12_FULL_35_15]
MKLKNIVDLLFMMVGTFAIVTGLIIVIQLFNGSLTFDKVLYAVTVFIFYFLIIFIRKIYNKNISKTN